MKISKLISDQLIKWSDIYEKSNYRNLAKKTKNTDSSLAAYGNNSSRFFDQTLQKMWKIRLSLCQGAGTWAKVLSFCKPDREKSSGRLCSTELSGTSRRLFAELSSYKRNSQRNLRYQRRTSASQAAIVGNEYALRNYHKHRYRRGSHFGCQYDQRTAKNSFTANFEQGGKSWFPKYRIIM